MISKYSRAKARSPKSGIGTALLSAALFSFITMLPATLVAQSGAGSLQGTVQDASGASVPHAKVHVLHRENGQTFDTEANGQGFYSVPNLFAGTYDITVTSEGMAKYESHLTLRAADTAVLDPKLVVGTATSVDVVGDVTPLLERENQTISTTLENERIQQLPINGRDITNLMYRTTPGLEGGGGSSLRINGNQSFAFGISIDGAPVVNSDIGGLTGRSQDPDTVQEVHVETSNSSAKFDRPGTAIITTKSGTNQFHGSLFETARNNGLGIARARGTTTTTPPKYIRNEFGGTFGGPILIPHVYDSHGKAFFFIGYERLSLRQEVHQNLYVPTAAMRNGDFSGITNANNQAINVYDPATTNSLGVRQQASVGGKANVFDPARISPLAKQLWAITPLPTNAANPYAAPNWQGVTPTGNTSPTLTGRLDYRFNQNNQFYIRGTDQSLENYTLNQTAFGPPTTDLQSNLTVSPQHTYVGAIGFSHIFTPRFFSETIIGNTWDTETVATGFNPSADWADKYGLPNNFGSKFYPIIQGGSTGAAQASLLTAYETADNTRNNVSMLTNIDENLTYIKGRHQWTFGARYRHDRVGIFPDQSPNPSTTTFNGNGTGQLQNTAGTPTSGTAELTQALTGLATADFFLGSASRYQVAQNHAYYHFRQQQIGFYAQDDVHLKPNLTVNLGIRWELYPAVSEANHSIPGFDVASKTVLLGQPVQKLIATGQVLPAVLAQEQALGVKFAYAGDLGKPLDVAHSNYANFSPRLGFAWSPFGGHRGTVLRGGFGVYLYPPAVRNLYFETRSSVPYASNFSYDLTSASQSPDGLPNYLVRSPQTIIAGSNSASVVNTTNGSSIVPGLQMSTLDADSKNEAARQTNVTIEQQLKFKTVLRISYVQNDGLNLQQYWEYNTAPPAIAWYTATNDPLPQGYYSAVARNPYDNRTYGTVEALRSTGYNHDYMGQVQLQRLYANGFAFQAYYVFSAAFRNGDNGFRDSFVYPLESFVPGSVNFSSQDDENRKINYVRDTTIPVHRVRANFVYDLPVGRGKRLLGKSSRWLDAILGGYQLAGYYEFKSTLFQPTVGLYGAIQAPFTIYKHAKKITDCSNGVCAPGYLWYNGFISPQRQAGGANGVNGLPSDYTPFQLYYNMDSTSSQNLTNNKTIKLNDGSTVNASVNPGPGNVANPFIRTFLRGPNVYDFDGSLYKVFHLHDRLNLKANVDVFNLFNVQGDVLPDTTTGIQYSLRAAANAPRQIQLSLKLVF